jgi:BMFP domain-containing protein YqiC
MPRNPQSNTVSGLLRFMSKVDSLTARVEQLEAKRKADEASTGLQD